MVVRSDPDLPTVRDLCEQLHERLDRVEETLQSLQRIEETVRRSEGIVAEWLQEISTSMTARFAEVEESTQRIASVVSQPTGPAVRLPWLARLAVPVLALAAAFAGGALLTTSRNTASQKVVSLTAPNQTPTPVAPTTTLPSTVDALGSEPQPRSRNRPSLASAPRPTTYVGSLSITSVPPGASVSINGKAAGVTPLRLHRQRAGSHAVQVAEEGFERWSAAVRVSADRLTEVTAKLRPIAR